MPGTANPRGLLVFSGERARGASASRAPGGLAARPLALLLLVALPASADVDGGLPPAVYAEKAQLLTSGGWVESECFGTDAGTACDGAWLPRPRLMSEGAELADLRARVPVLEATPRLFSTGTWVTIAVFFAAGVFLGGFSGWMLARFVDGH